MAKDSEKLVIYTAEGCGPCDELKSNLDGMELEGVAPNAEVELVDIMTDEGFERFQQLDAEIDYVPTAFYEGQRCELLEDDQGKLMAISCLSGRKVPRNDQAPGTSAAS